MNNFATNAFHTSAKTSISTNTDADTGAKTRRLTTSTIEMFWRDGLLVIQGKTSAITLPVREIEGRSRLAAKRTSR